MNDLPNRKRLRLEQYDYSSPGAYFVTFCTKDRQCILSDITVGADALGGPHGTVSNCVEIPSGHLYTVCFCC